MTSDTWATITAIVLVCGTPSYILVIMAHGTGLWCSSNMMVTVLSLLFL